MTGAPIRVPSKISDQSSKAFQDAMDLPESLVNGFVYKAECEVCGRAGEFNILLKLGTHAAVQHKCNSEECRKAEGGQFRYTLIG